MARRWGRTNSRTTPLSQWQTSRARSLPSRRDIHVNTSSSREGHIAPGAANDAVTLFSNERIALTLSLFLTRSPTLTVLLICIRVLVRGDTGFPRADCLPPPLSRLNVNTSLEKTLIDVKISIQGIPSCLQALHCVIIIRWTQTIWNNPPTIKEGVFNICCIINSVYSETSKKKR